MSKYFPIRNEYKATTSFSDRSCMMEMYGAIRQILKDCNTSTRKYSVGSGTKGYHKEGVVWHIYPDTGRGGSNPLIIIPFAELQNAGALLMKMGVRTQQEAWDEYKDLWYEDLEKQLSHIEKGNGP